MAFTRMDHGAAPVQMGTIGTRLENFKLKEKSITKFCVRKTIYCKQSVHLVKTELKHLNIILYIVFFRYDFL